MSKEFNNKTGPEINERKGSPTWLKLLELGGILGTACASFIGATQYVASSYNYHEYLGRPLFGHFYSPFSVLAWMNDPNLSSRSTIETARLILFAGIAGVVIVIAIIKFASDKSFKGMKYLHGSAHWADEDDLVNAGLYNVKKRPVVYVGGFLDKKHKFHYLMHAGPEHILCYAPTRSGKGVGLVMPTMLQWTDSAIVNDIKGELWALTSGWRNKYAHNTVIKWEPAAEDSAHWNPLDEIRVGTVYEVSDVQNLAQLFVDPDGKGMDGADGHWKKTAYALYTGVFLYVIHRVKCSKYDDFSKNPLMEESMSKITAANFHEVDYLLSSKNVKELWQEMVDYQELCNEKKYPQEYSIRKIIASAGQDMLDRPDEEAGSVLSTVKSNLSLYRDPIVTENTKNSDFKIHELMHGKKKKDGSEEPSPAMTVYMVQQPADKARIRPLVRIFISMCMRVLADKMEFENGRSVFKANHKLLVMLDEFPALGKMDIVQESLAFVAGYGIKCYLITQDLEQLRNAYGDHESVTSNCHIQIAFPAMNPLTMKHLSDMTGTTTIIKESVTKSGSGFNVSKSRSMQEIARPLLTPDECRNLPGPKKEGDKIVEAGDMLVFVAGYPAIYGKQPLYFLDPVFNARSKLPAPKKVVQKAPEAEKEKTEKTKQQKPGTETHEAGAQAATGNDNTAKPEQKAETGNDKEAA